MLDIKFIRENSRAVEKAAQDKGAAVDIAAILALDEERRSILSETGQTFTLFMESNGTDVEMVDVTIDETDSLV